MLGAGPWDVQHYIFDVTLHTILHTYIQCKQTNYTPVLLKYLYTHIYEDRVSALYFAWHWLIHQNSLHGAERVNLQIIR